MFQTCDTRYVFRVNETIKEEPTTSVFCSAFPPEGSEAKPRNVNVDDGIIGDSQEPLTHEQDKELERIVGNCVANQRFEGLICDEEDKAAVRRIVCGETTAEEEVAKVLAKYRS